MVRKHSKMYVVSGLFPMSGSAICYNWSYFILNCITVIFPKFIRIPTSVSCINVTSVSPVFSFSLTFLLLRLFPSFPLTSFLSRSFSSLSLIIPLSPHLTVVSVGNGVLIVWRKHKILHNAFNTRDDLACQVRRRQIPRDELVRNADDIPQVVRQSESEHGELVAF